MAVLHVYATSTQLIHRRVSAVLLCTEVCDKCCSRCCCWNNVFVCLETGQLLSIGEESRPQFFFGDDQYTSKVILFHRTFLRSLLLSKCNEIFHRILLWWKMPEFRSSPHFSDIINAFEVQWNLHRATGRDENRESQFEALSHFVALKLSHFHSHTQKMEW